MNIDKQIKYWSSLINESDVPRDYSSDDKFEWEDYLDKTYGIVRDMYQQGKITKTLAEMWIKALFSEIGMYNNDVQDSEKVNVGSFMIDAKKRGLDVGE